MRDPTGQIEANGIEQGGGIEDFRDILDMFDVGIFREFDAKGNGQAVSFAKRDANAPARG